MNNFRSIVKELDVVIISDVFVNKVQVIVVPFWNNQTVGNRNSDCIFNWDINMNYGSIIEEDIERVGCGAIYAST